MEIPQADSLAKIRAVVEVVKRRPGISASEAGSAIDLTPRHGAYYASAAQGLGLLKEGRRLFVTQSADVLLKTPRSSSQEASCFRQLVDASEVVRRLAPDLLGSEPPAHAILTRRIERVGRLSESTAARRADTLLRWRHQILGGERQLSLEELGKAPMPKVKIEKLGKARILAIRLKGFKGFREATLNVGGFTIVVGTNAAGKSNLRDAFRFLHGIGRGYALAEIIGQRHGEGGEVQWKGIRGGAREISYRGIEEFTVEVDFELVDDAPRPATYCITVGIGRPNGGMQLKVVAERLVVEGRGQYIFDSHPPRNAPSQEDANHLAVRIKKPAKKGFLGKSLALFNTRPALAQLREHHGASEDVKYWAEVVSESLESMRFLDLSPDKMREASFPGQVVLGDGGENLSSVLMAICEQPRQKKTLVEWLRALTPLDVTDLKFPPDQIGRVLVTLVADERETSAFSASDGTLRFLAMIAAFLGPDPARFYFFEELETGLHPTRLHLLLNLIESQTRRRVSQVVATTHSPQLLRFLSKEVLGDAVLAYRIPESPEQYLKRIIDFYAVQAGELDVGQLLESGWLENAVVLEGRAGEVSSGS